MDVLSAPFVGFFLILVIWILAWDGLVLGLRILFMRFVEMTSRIRLRPELAICFWVCWMWNACADAFVLLEVVLMRAWAAAAFLDPHALVSVFGVSLVTTTLRHDHKGSRFAFEQAKATPRVDVAETPQASPFLEAQEKNDYPVWSQLGVLSFTPCSCTHWSNVGGAVVLL